MQSHSRRLCLSAMQPVRKEALMEKSPMDLAEAKYSFFKLQKKNHDVMIYPYVKVRGLTKGEEHLCVLTDCI